MRPEQAQTLVILNGRQAGDGDKTLQAVLMSLGFLLGCLPCMTQWVLLGVTSARLFGSPQTFKQMIQTLAFLRLVSAWLTVLE